MEILTLTTTIGSRYNSKHPCINSLLNYSFSLSSYTKQHNNQIHRAPRKSFPSLSLTIPRASSRPLLASARSLSDDGVYGVATKVIDVDPSLAVKKKAVEISSELKGTSIFLVGMKSAIKSSLGKLLADGLRYYYFDSDSLVEEAAGGESAARSFKEKDEKGFRDSETEVLKQLSSMGRLVVCAGDGAVQNSTSLALLRHGISIWIDVPLDMVAKDMIKVGSLPPASEIPAEGSSYETNEDQVFSQLIALYEEMKRGYATADATVSLQRVASQLGCDELDAVTTEHMALEVLKEIEKLTRVKKMMEEAARPF